MHGANFAKVIKGQMAQFAPLDEAIISDCISHMSDIAIRTGKEVNWDPEKGTITNLPERRVFFGYGPKLGTAMRDGHWKMLTKGDVVELYDLSKDIKETTNVKDKYPGRTDESSY